MAKSIHLGTLLESAVEGGVNEADFIEQFTSSCREGTLITTEAEAACFNQLIEDFNMAEHSPPLFTARFCWKMNECLRLIRVGAKPEEIKDHFRHNQPPSQSGENFAGLTTLRLND